MTSAPIAVKFLPMVETETKHPEFAKRLSEAMQAAGVTVTDIKNHLKVTYEMARRYTIGVAMPRDDKLVVIAQRLSVQTAWLKFGDAISIPKVERSAHLKVSKPSSRYGEERWPLKKTTPDRFYALTPAQRKEADVAFDTILRGYEAEREKKP